MSKDTPIAMAGSSVMPTEGSLISRRDLPKMTVGTSEEYNEKVASVLSHAMLPNVVWRRFVQEGTDGIGSDTSDEKLLPAYHSLVEQHLASGAGSGAFIAEAGDFSACAFWWPPGSQQPPKDHKGFDEQERQGKTLMAAFGREIEKIQIEQIWSRYGQEFWYLGLLARDPRKPALPGAVRAVLQPVIDQAAAEGKPIWVATTSEHAREMYLHFGFQMVRMVTVDGHNQWCMILYPPSSAKT